MDNRTNPRAVVEDRIADLESIIEAANAQAARSDISGTAYHAAKQRAGQARRELEEKRRWLFKNAAKYAPPAA